LLLTFTITVTVLVIPPPVAVKVRVEAPTLADGVLVSVNVLAPLPGAEIVDTLRP